MRQDLVRWADENVLRADRGTGPVLMHGFTDPRLVQSAVRGAELYFVGDDMTWLARAVGEGLPVCAFDADDLPDPLGLLLWSDDPSAHTATLGRPRAVVWSRAATTLRVLALDDAGPYRRALEEEGRQVDPTWAHQVNGLLAGNLAVAFGAVIPFGVETDWDQVQHAWSMDKNGNPVQDRYGLGDSKISTITDDQLRVLRTLLGTLLLIRQPADERRGLWQSEDVQPDPAARKRLRRAGAERLDAKVRYITLRRSARPAPGDDNGSEDTAGRIYRHRWFVKPHRRAYPDKDHPAGKSRRWVGPYLVTPAGCADAPILGTEKVNVLCR